MPRILVDARAIADPANGGVCRVAKQWIVAKTQQSPALPVTCVTTGYQVSSHVRSFCDDNAFDYKHIGIPNKFWTVGCLLNGTSIIMSAEKRMKDAAELFLIPNLGFTGPLYRPYHLLIHDLSFLIDEQWFNLKRRLWHRFIPVKRLIQNADQIDCVSEQTRRDVLRFFNVEPERCHLFQINPTVDCRLSTVDSACVRPNWLPAHIERFALLLGGSDPRKNIRTALAAIDAYNQSNPDQSYIPVVLGGPVHLPVGKPRIAYLQAPNFVSDADLAWLYVHTTALLYPSWYEGFGLPLHEAKQFNAPVIASTAGALPETAPPGTIFCHPAKVHEWVQALHQITNHKNI